MMSNCGYNSAVEAMQNMKLRERDSYLKDNPQMWKILLWQAENMPACVLPNIFDPIVVCGVTHRFGVGEAWMVASDELHGRNAAIVLIQQRNVIQSLYQSLNLHRLHMVIDEDFGKAKFWAEKLGFVYESTNKRMGSRGQNVELWIFNNERG